MLFAIIPTPILFLLSAALVEAVSRLLAGTVVCYNLWHSDNKLRLTSTHTRMKSMNRLYVRQQNRVLVSTLMCHQTDRNNEENYMPQAVYTNI